MFRNDGGVSCRQQKDEISLRRLFLSTSFAWRNERKKKREKESVTEILNEQKIKKRTIYDVLHIKGIDFINVKAKCHLFVFFFFLFLFTI